jgi:hypothetical protein
MKKGSEDPESFRQAQRFIDDLTDDLQNNFGDTIDVDTFNGLKRSYDANAFSNAGDRVTSEPRKAIADFFRDKVHKNVKSLKPINEDYSTALLSRKILEKALGKSEIGLVGKIASTGAGAVAGSSVGGPGGAAVGTLVGEKLASNLFGTASKTTRAQVLDRFGKLLDNVTSGDGQISRAALLNIISDLEGSE